jgi:very-short-patch-repair endonuclease
MRFIVMGCEKCDCFVSNKEYDYSIKNYGKVLCRMCQVDYSNLRNKHQERRKRATLEARKLYEILLKNGFNAKLELWDGYKTIDIAIPDYKINIEVDGKQHQGKKQALADLKRTYHSFKKGYVTLRIPNELVRESLFDTVNYIMKFLKESDTQLNEGLEEED